MIPNFLRFSGTQLKIFNDANAFIDVPKNNFENFSEDIEILEENNENLETSEENNDDIEILDETNASLEDVESTPLENESENTESIISEN